MRETGLSYLFPIHAFSLTFFWKKVIRTCVGTKPRGPKPRPFDRSGTPAFMLKLGVSESRRDFNEPLHIL